MPNVQNCLKPNEKGNNDASNTTMKHVGYASATANSTFLKLSKL